MDHGGLDSNGTTVVPFTNGITVIPRKGSESSHMSTQNVFITLPPICTREEWGRLTGLAEKGPTVVLGMCNQGTLPTVKVGRHDLVNVHQILQDLASGKTEFLAGDYR